MTHPFDGNGDDDLDDDGPDFSGNKIKNDNHDDIETDGPDGAEPTADDMAAAILDLEMQRRLWVRTLTAFMAARFHDEDPSPRVQLAYDLAHIAAAERLARIMRSDLTDAGSDQT